MRLTNNSNMEELQMLEEEKVVEAEVVEEEAPVQEEPKQEQQGGLEPLSKNALMGFIFAVLAAGFCFGYIAGFVGSILGFVALAFNKKAAGVERKPFSAFYKVSKIVAPIAIVIGFVMTVVAIIVLIVTGIAAAAAAAQG